MVGKYLWSSVCILHFHFWSVGVGGHICLCWWDRETTSIYTYQVYPIRLSLLVNTYYSLVHSRMNEQAHCEKYHTAFYVEVLSMGAYNSKSYAYYDVIRYIYWLFFIFIMLKLATLYTLVQLSMQMLLDISIDYFSYLSYWSLLLCILLKPPSLINYETGVI